MSMFGSGGVVDRGLGLGFTNPMRTWEMLDVCQCFCCGGVAGVGGVGGVGGEGGCESCRWCVW